MDDGEIDLSSHLFSSNSFAGDFEELLKSTSTCTHTHTCNPPGPNVAGHTHTCYHTHTRVFSSSEGEDGDRGNGQEQKRPRKPLGNREAVRKYREKKKAHTAFLEEEVKKLRQVNQQLLKRVQGQAALEAEVLRLRALLGDLRGKIDTELGMFPFHKQCSTSNLQCDGGFLPCSSQNVSMAGWEASCGPAVIGCQVDREGNMGQHMEMETTNSMDMVGSFVSSASHANQS